jgi:hypothetical protein
VNTKLTLSVDEATVKRAKRYARQKRTSLSKIVEQQLNQLTKNGHAKNKKSVVDSLVGIIKGVPENVDYKDLIASWRDEKHGL